MKKKYFNVFLAFFSIILIHKAPAAEDSLLYKIGYLDLSEIDFKAFIPDTEFFVLDMIRASDGNFSKPNDFSGVCQMYWNHDALIIQFDITDNELVISAQDDQLWSTDCIELFLAPGIGSPGYYQLVLAIQNNGALRFRFYDFRYNKEIPLTHSSSGIRTDSGYRIKTHLAWSNLGIEVKEGTEIGIQIFANDVDSDEQMRQWQWYPHAVSHSSDWMHRIQLQNTTTDKHLINATAAFVGDDIRIDCFSRQLIGFDEFDVVDNNNQKVAVGCLRQAGNGLNKASVLIPSQRSYPVRLKFLNNGNIAGQAVVLKSAITDAPNSRVLQETVLVPESRYGYLFETASTPQVKWSEAEKIKEITGNNEMQIRWFDTSLEEVTSFEKPGRYLVYGEIRLPDDRVLKRSATFYAIAPDSHPWRKDTRLVLYNRTRPWWHPWRGLPHAQMDFPAGLGFEQKVWQDNQPLLSPWAGKVFFEFLESDPYGPVLLSYLSESGRYAELPVRARTPEIANDEIHLALKRKLLHTKTTSKSLLLPQTVSDESPRLRDGKPEEAGFSDDAPRQIRELCTQWYKDSNEPFAVLIARNGVILFHEAFGRDADGNQVTVETPMFMASITKCMTGLVFGQFVEQGLMGIDEPIGHFLPDFPVEGRKVITFRHCFTHTTGLTGHYEFGGMHNPWLENAIAMGLPLLPVGKVHEYNGMGYDLAGKAMEIAAEKSAFRIMHEYLYEPLAMTHTVLDDMATCSTSIPLDIAKLGQLILNGGVYGGKRFFSPDTLNELLPCELNQYFPEIQKNWGIGMTWMLTDNPDSDKTVKPCLFSSKVVGHGAASSAVFRVDLENKLIVVQTRNRAGRNYDQYLLEFLKTIDRTMKR